MNKLFMIVTATLLMTFSPLTVFASTEPIQYDEVIPYDSHFVANLNTSSFTKVQEFARPLLFPFNLQITNHHLNRGSIIVRVVDTTGRLLDSDQTITPGEATSFYKVPPSLMLDYYIVYAKAVSNPGPYSININQGDDDNIIPTQLNPTSWNNLTNVQAPLLGTKVYTVTNHPDSPETAIVRVVTDNGTLVSTQTIQPGTEAQFVIGGISGAQTYIFQAKSVSVQDQFFFTVIAD